MDAYMARMNFTAQRIATHQCEEGKDYSFIWDTGAKSLGLQATKGGSKSYVFQSRLHGKPLRITIGSPLAWSIPDARAEANRLQVMVDQGIDPRVVAAEQKAKHQAQETEKAAKKLSAREVWDAYLAAPHPKWGPRHRTDHINAAQEGGEKPKRGDKLTNAGPLASLLCFPLHEITPEAVAAWLEKESKARATATTNAYRKFRTFINWCAEQPQYKSAAHADCCTTSAVKNIVPRNKPKEDDCLEREQLAKWFTAVRGIPNECISAYLQGLLITGARRGELERLQWNDVDFQWRKMTIRDKVEGERTIPLTPYLCSLLRSLPRLNQWVFSSPTSANGYIVGFPKAHTEVVAAAALPHVSLHGLRRSFATLSEWIDVPTGIVAQIMGHKPSAIAEKHYKKRSIDLLRHHHEKIEAWMLKQAGIEFTGK
jgi:integrase